MSGAPSDDDALVPRREAGPEPATRFETMTRLP